MDDLMKNCGPWALVLGASEGLGEAWAREAAARGLSVVLVARRADALEQVATAIAADHGVGTRTVQADVGAEYLVETLARATGDLEVGLVIYNATAGHIGTFLEQDPGHAQLMVDVNCRGPLRIAHHYGRAMRDRGRGGIILMSSGAALAGGPGNAVYAASKAFDLVLGEGLSREFRAFGVEVLSIIGPAIDTPNFWRENPSVDGMVAPPMNPAELVREAYAQLGEVSSWIPGETWRAGLSALLTLPREQQIDAMAASVRAMYGERR